jgi:phytoene dehydrogenase-like protein
MKKKLIIIGGGIAGLSTGIYGRMNDFDCEIIEMHTIAGGQCTAWERKGYRFDYCLHWLVGTARGPYNKIWKETGALDDSTKIINHEIFNRIIDTDNNEFIIYSDINRWREYLIKSAPEDADAINKMCKDMNSAVGLDDLMTFLEKRSIAQLIKNFPRIVSFILLLMRYSKKNVKQYVEILKLKNKNLKYFLESSFGENDFSAIAFLMMLAWFSAKNAGYVIGGSLPLAKRMADKYESLGGKFRYGSRVTRIIVENNRAAGVILEDGTVIKSDYVISAADGHSTIFDMLEGKYLSEQINDAYNNWELFVPIVQVSFGINKKVTSESDLFVRQNNRISIGSTKLKQGYSFLNYSFDPTMAPEGKTVIVLRFESPWDFWEKLSRDEYLAEKEAIKKDALELLRKEFTGLDDFIEVIDVATPKTDFDYTGVWRGSYEGFTPSSKNMTKSLKMELPGLNNFLMVGQWLTPGGGLPPSAESGKKAIKMICKKEKLEFSAS